MKRNDLFTLLLANASGYAKRCSREKFAESAVKFVKNEMPSEMFLGLCNTLLEDARILHNPSFAAEVYAFRAVIHWKNADMDDARDDANEALLRDGKTALAHQVLFNVHMARQKYSKAAMELETLAVYADSPAEKRRLQAMAKDLHMRGSAMEATALQRLYAQNECEANARYGGAAIAVSGIVSSLVRSSLGWPKVILCGKDDVSASVDCLFPKGSSGCDAPLGAGQEILISGICQGLYRGRVLLRECRILETTMEAPAE